MRGIDLDGKTVVLEGKGIMGRMLQHETDHLDGHIYTEIAYRKLSDEEIEQLHSGAEGDDGE